MQPAVRLHRGWVSLIILSSICRRYCHVRPVSHQIAFRHYWAISDLGFHRQDWWRTLQCSTQQHDWTRELRRASFSQLPWPPGAWCHSPLRGNWMRRRLYACSREVGARGTSVRPKHAVHPRWCTLSERWWRKSQALQSWLRCRIRKSYGEEDGSTHVSGMWCILSSGGEQVFDEVRISFYHNQRHYANALGKAILTALNPPDPPVLDKQKKASRWGRSKSKDSAPLTSGM